MSCPHTDAERAAAGCPVCLKAEREGWRDHAIESDKEFFQLEDWLIGNAEHNEDGSLRDRAKACRERIRDLVAAEAERAELRTERDRLRQALEPLPELLDDAERLYSEASEYSCNCGSDEMSCKHCARLEHADRILHRVRHAAREVLGAKGGGQ